MNCKGDNCGLEKHYPDKLSILIVDDDTKATEKLKAILNQDQAISINTIENVDGVAEQIQTIKPDLIFIDPFIKDGAGLTLIDQVTGMEEKPGIIAVASDKNELEKVFRLHMLTMIKKPYDTREVHRSIQEYLSIRSNESLRTMMDDLLAGLTPKKLKFSTRKGHVFLSANEIIYCKADSNYTHLVLTGNRQITVSKSLHHFDHKVLSPYYFRISRSAIINTEYLIEINRNEKNCILKQNGELISLPVTQKYLKILLNHYCNCYTINQ